MMRMPTPTLLPMSIQMQVVPAMRRRTGTHLYMHTYAYMHANSTRSVLSAFALAHALQARRGIHRGRWMSSSRADEVASPAAAAAASAASAAPSAPSATPTPGSTSSARRLRLRWCSRIALRSLALLAVALFVTDASQHDIQHDALPSPSSPLSSLRTDLIDAHDYDGADASSSLSPARLLRSTTAALNNVQHSSFIALLAMTRLTRNVICAVRITLDYVISLRGLEGAEREAKLEEIHIRGARVLRDTFNANGGVYIKFGQHVAQMFYLLPHAYPTTMQSMLAAAPTSSFDEVRRTIEEETGRPLEETFAYLDTLPAASASLAQVHFGRLHDGSDVAVKVQHRFLKHTVAADIAMMRWTLRAVRYLFPSVDYAWLVDETERSLPRECDFGLEAINADHCRVLFAHRDDVKVPRIYHDLSSRRVLVMERVYGVMASEKKRIESMNISPDEVSQVVSEVFSEMIFQHGFVHADPHPGNILVASHRGTRHPQIILLDHGLYANLSDDFRVLYARLWKALILADTETIRECCQAMNAGDMYQLFASMITRKPWNEIDDSSLDHLQTRNTSDAREQLVKYTQQFSLEIQQLLARMPRQMVLLFKTNECLRHIDSMLDARTDSFVSMARECTHAINQHRWDQTPTLGTALANSLDWARVEARIWLYQCVMFAHRVASSYRAFLSTLWSPVSMLRSRIAPPAARSHSLALR